MRKYLGPALRVINFIGNLTTFFSIVGVLGTAAGVVIAIFTASNTSLHGVSRGFFMAGVLVFTAALFVLVAKVGLVLMPADKAARLLSGEPPAPPAAGRTFATEMPRAREERARRQEEEKEKERERDFLAALQAVRGELQYDWTLLTAALADGYYWDNWNRQLRSEQWDDRRELLARDRRLVAALPTVQAAYHEVERMDAIADKRSREQGDYHALYENERVADAVEAIGMAKLASDKVIQSL
jgi:hypothetical protein